MNTIFAFLLAVSATQFPPSTEVFPNSETGSAVTSGGTVTADLDLAGYRLYSDLLGGAGSPMFMWDGAGSGASVYFGYGGNSVLAITTTGLQLIGNRGLYWNSATILNGSTDGDLLITNAAATNGGILRWTADGYFDVRNMAGTSYGGVNALAYSLAAPAGLAYSASASTLVTTMRSAWELQWSSTTLASGTKDVGLKRVSANVLGVTNGSTGYGTLYAYNLIATGGYIQLPATTQLQWAGRAELTSPADGKMILYNDAQTIGAMFDASSTGIMTLSDQSGANYQLQVHTSLHSTITSISAATGLNIFTKDNASALNSGDMDIYTGAHTNAGDYKSGNVNISSGPTTTDGNTGDINIYSGAAGAGASDAGVINFGINGSTSATTNWEAGETTVTFSGGGDASQTASNFRVAQRKIYGISGRVTTTGTTCTSIDIGDGVDVDRYGAGIAVSSGTTFDINDATADPEEFLTTAGDIVITANGGNCVDLVVVLTRHQRGYTAATAP